MPAKRAASPRRSIGQPRRDVSDRQVTTRVDSPASFKFGLHVDAAGGSMIYLDTRRADRSVLILRSYALHEPEAYADYRPTRRRLSATFSRPTWTTEP